MKSCLFLAQLFLNSAEHILSPYRNTQTISDRFFTGFTLFNLDFSFLVERRDSHFCEVGALTEPVTRLLQGLQRLVKTNKRKQQKNSGCMSCCVFSSLSIFEPIRFILINVHTYCLSFRLVFIISL